jgi:hypothetical protein
MDIHLLPQSESFIGISYLHSIQCTASKKEELTALSQGASPLAILGLLVSF